MCLQNDDTSEPSTTTRTDLFFVRCSSLCIHQYSRHNSQNKIKKRKKTYKHTHRASHSKKNTKKLLWKKSCKKVKVVCEQQQNTNIEIRLLCNKKELSFFIVSHISERKWILLIQEREIEIEAIYNTEIHRKQCKSEQKVRKLSK